MRKVFLSIAVLFLSLLFIPNTNAQITFGKKKPKIVKKTGYDPNGDLIKIGGPFSDNGITGDIHEKYVGKIMFAKDIIPGTGANESDFVSEFGISDYIYGRLYMPKSVENYPIYENKSLVAGDTINPDHNSYGKFYYTLVVLAAICLAFPPTRIYSVILTGLLLYIYPYVTLGVLVLAGIAFYFYRRTIA